MSDSQNIVGALLSVQDRWQSMPIARWFEMFKQATAHYSNSIDRALLAGRLSSNVGFAFAGAYQSAIESLFKLEEPLLASVCITESEGNHPRAIKARLYSEGGVLRLSGEKSFVSGAKDAGMLFVACRDERKSEGLDKDGRPIIKLLALRADRAGINIQEMPSLGFLPELSHGKVVFQGLELEESDILPGDGYIDYVKAFRSYEDLHVCAAIAAYRLGEAITQGWGKELVAQHISLILALRAVNDMSLDSAVAHVSLAACRNQLDELITSSNSLFQQTDDQAYERWQRDSRILQLARKAHEQRTQKAWKVLTCS
jgi:hypothetical protein